MGKLTPLLAFVITRLGIALVAYMSMPLLQDADIPVYHVKPDQLLLDAFGSRWDNGFFMSIADEGYVAHGVQFPSVAFFPLLPLLIRAGNLLVGDTLLSGLIVSNLALLGASILFYRLVLDEYGEQMAGRAVWLMLIFPTSFFGSSIYSESLFLLTAVGALYLFRHGYWESAAMLGFLCALTRFMGILVAALLLMEWWLRWRKSEPDQRPPLAALLAPAAVPLGTFVYMLYLGRQFGDPLAFLHASQAWGRQPGSPMLTILQVFQTPVAGWESALAAGRLPLDSWIDLGFVTVFVVLGVVLLWQKRWSEGVFVTLGSLIPLSTSLMMSQRRYVWVLFPAFILLARWGERVWVERVIVTFSLLLLGLFTAMFANWYWVG